MSDYNNDQYSNQESRGGAYNPDGFSGGNMTQGGSYGGGGGYRADDDDLRGAARHAEQEAGDSGDSNLFSNVLGMLGQKKQNLQDEDLDEQDAVRSHQQFFGGGGGAQDRSADTSSMGSAAAMQALKMFSGGGSGNSQSGNSQNAFVGMAMAQASKLFDQQNAQGNVAASADKESVVQKAGETALKMYLKSQGGNSGLMGMAAKFL